MTDSTMPKRETGVHANPKSQNWWWRIKSPDDLSQEFPTYWAHRCSLGTSDLRKANLLALELRADWLKRFEDARTRLNPARAAAITPEFIDLICKQVRHRALAGDAGRRTERDDYAQSARDLKKMNLLEQSAPEKDLGKLDAMPSEHLAFIARLNATLEEASIKALAHDDLGLVLKKTQQSAARMGVLIDEDTPGIEDLLRAVLRAEREVSAELRQRDAGIWIPTPAAPSAPDPVSTAKSIPAAQKSEAMTLRKVFDKWKVADVRGKDAMDACGRALKLFEDSLEGAPLPVAEITRAHGTDFKGWLVAKIAADEMSSKTAHDRLTSVKGLLRFAFEELEAIPKHPWRGLDIKHKTENPRRPWTHAHLQTMVGLPLFAAYELPSAGKTAWKGGGAAAYWVPLLGLFTGATVSELCQLRTNDVEIAADGSGLIHITEDDEGQQLKNFEHRRRVVPIHSQLVRLGFLTYVAMLSPGSLWPNMKFRKGKPGAYFSDWFGKFRKPTPEAEPLFPDFHSMRHTVRSKLTAAAVEVSIQDRLTGHTVKGSAGSRVYTHVETPQLRAAIETISYPGIEFPNAYPTKNA